MDCEFFHEDIEDLLLPFGQTGSLYGRILEDVNDVVDNLYLLLCQILD